MTYYESGSQLGDDATNDHDGNPKDQELTLNLFSKANGHWSLMLNRIEGDVAESNRMYHVQEDPNIVSDNPYLYTSPENIGTPYLFAKTRICKLSNNEREEFSEIMERYGRDPSHLPEVSRGENCQDFAVNMLVSLEENNKLPAGTHKWFREQIGKPGTEIEAAAKQDGRHWFAPPQVVFTGTPDASFNQAPEKAPVRKLFLSEFSKINFPRMPPPGTDN